MVRPSASSFDEIAFRSSDVRVVTFDRFTPAFVDPGLTAEGLQRKFGTFLLANARSNRSVQLALSTDGNRYVLKSPLFANDGDTGGPLGKKHLEETLKLMLLEEYRNAQAVSNVKGFPYVYGIGSLRGFPVIVSEHISGTTLAEVLDRLPRNTEGRGMSSLIAANIVQAATKALLNAQCLDGAFVHRDLSPRNIIIKTDERPLGEQVGSGIFDIRLVDMGSATYCLPTSPFATIKHGIWRFGTAEYAAPEMLTKDVEGIVSKRHSETIDTYALCSILYLLLTGGTPFSLFTRPNSSPYLVKTKEVPRIPAVAPESETLLQLAISGITAQQENRYSVRALYQTLESWRASHA